MATDHEVIDRLARIETKLDSALSQLTDHESRLRLTDRWRYALSTGTALSLLGAMGSFVRVALP